MDVLTEDEEMAMCDAVVGRGVSMTDVSMELGLAIVEVLESDAEVLARVRKVVAIGEEVR